VYMYLCLLCIFVSLFVLIENILLVSCTLDKLVNLKEFISKEGEI
jgi:hypothetical protein